MGKAKAKLTPAEKAQRRSHTIKHLKQYSALYAMMILPVLYFIIFKYVPMVGNILAFRRYRPGQGMFGTEWTLRYFERFLKDPDVLARLPQHAGCLAGKSGHQLPAAYHLRYPAERSSQQILEKDRANDFLYAPLHLNCCCHRHHERGPLPQHGSFEQLPAQRFRHDTRLLHE